jgi:isoquinoline 1-oxidoreductase alpha subunit
VLEVNGVRVALPEHLREAPLLDVIREHMGLRGTKYGCAKGLCGACTVHLDGVAVRSCQLPAAGVEGRRVTTIEGLAAGNGAARLHPVQEAWIAESVPQCGYCQPGQIMTAAALLASICQPGQIMTAAALLASIPNPSEEQIRRAMEGNLCRCGTYPRIRRALRRVAEGR